MCDINPKSKAENKEYAGTIYRNPDGTYSYTAPALGDAEHSDPTKSLPPEGFDVDGIYHTHGAYLPELGAGNFRFSSDDISFARNFNQTSYMADPADNIHKYDPGASNGRGKATRLK